MFWKIRLFKKPLLLQPQKPDRIFPQNIDFGVFFGLHLHQFMFPMGQPQSVGAPHHFTFSSSAEHEFDLIGLQALGHIGGYIPINIGMFPYHIAPFPKPRPAGMRQVDLQVGKVQGHLVDIHGIAHPARHGLGRMPDLKAHRHSQLAAFGVQGIDLLVIGRQTKAERMQVNELEPIVFNGFFDLANALFNVERIVAGRTDDTTLDNAR